MPTADNLALSCHHKYDKIERSDPASGKVVPRYHPRRDRRRDHFVWSDDFTLLVGVSPTGRATIVAMPLNRQTVVNLRRLLGRTGKHPAPESVG